MQSKSNEQEHGAAHAYAHQQKIAELEFWELQADLASEVDARPKCQPEEQEKYVQLQQECIEAIGQSMDKIMLFCAEQEMKQAIGDFSACSAYLTSFI